MAFTYSHTDPTSQPHLIFGVTPTSLDFGAKNIHKIHHVFNPDSEY
jgi:hypothetical protein